jgi:hypothetical protein
LIDFASVTAVQVKEGPVKQIHMGSQKVWDVDRWEIDWKWNGALPSSSKWTYPVGSGTVTNASSQNAILLSSAGYDEKAGIYPKAGTFTPSNRCIFEAEIKVTHAFHQERGVHIGVSNADGSSGLLAYIYTDPEASCLVITTRYGGYRDITLDEWYTVRLELDTVNKNSCVYIDNVLVDSVGNGSLETPEISAPYLTMIASKCYVRAIRYKRMR